MAFTRPAALPAPPAHFPQRGSLLGRELTKPAGSRHGFRDWPMDLPEVELCRRLAAIAGGLTECPLVENRRRRVDLLLPTGLGWIAFEAKTPGKDGDPCGPLADAFRDAMTYRGKALDTSDGPLLPDYWGVLCAPFARWPAHTAQQLTGIRQAANRLGVVSLTCSGGRSAPERLRVLRVDSADAQVGRAYLPQRGASDA